MNRVAAAMDDKQSPLPSKSDPTENLKRKPEKGILKQSTSFESENAAHGQGKKSRQSTLSATKTMKFDEMNILQTLHPPDKDYGHMKIDEPNTPYEKSLPDETDAVDPYDLAEKIVQGRLKKPKVLDQPSSSSEDEDVSEDAKEKKRAFAIKRKAHYNEFLAAKQALEALVDEDEEEE